jgi:hypothetical protein
VAAIYGVRLRGRRAGMNDAILISVFLVVAVLAVRQWLEWSDLGNVTYWLRWLVLCPIGMHASDADMRARLNRAWGQREPARCIICDAIAENPRSRKE